MLGLYWGYMVTMNKKWRLLQWGYIGSWGLGNLGFLFKVWGFIRLLLESLFFCALSVALTFLAAVSAFQVTMLPGLLPRCVPFLMPRFFFIAMVLIHPIVSTAVTVLGCCVLKGSK